MRFKTEIVLAVAGACLLTLSVSAFALPPPRDHTQALLRERGGMSNVPLPPHRPARLQLASRTPMSTMQRMVAVSTSMFNGPALVAEARKYLGTNPTDRKSLWCATFMNFILAKLGYAGTNSDAAKSFAYYGHRLSEPRIGAIAVLTRGRRGGHVGVVSGIDANGNPVIISGNHNRRVGIGVYPRSRVIAYVMPTRRYALPVRFASRVPVSATSIDSPITELLATINAEPERREVRASTPEAARPVHSARMMPSWRATRRMGRMRPVHRPSVIREALAERPYRLVQQVPDQSVRRYPPLDPALVKLFDARAGAPRQQASR